MGGTDILWGNAESLQQLFGQSVRELAPAGEPEVILEIGPLLPVVLIGDKPDEAYFGDLQIFF